MRGKSFFVKKTFPEQAHQDYTPQQLLRMGKQDMTRVLCAYGTNLWRRSDFRWFSNDLGYLEKVFIKPGNRTTIWC